MTDLDPARGFGVPVFGRVRDAGGPLTAQPGFRDVIGGGLVALAVAAGCFGCLAAIAPARDGGSAALIGLDWVATVAGDTLYVDRERRC